MKLGKLNVTTGAQKAPLRELVYGTEGVGKTSFAADAPAPIFIGEDGTKRLEVSRVEPPHTWDEFTSAIRALRTEDHPFKTVVLDTLDHLEVLAFRHVAKLEKRASIDDIGFGKGYTKALNLCWNPLLAELEVLQRERGLNVLLLAHAQVKTFKNPAGDDYDRYTLKIHHETAARVRGWAESVLFASFDVATDKKKPRSEARWLYTERSPAFDAKNRYGLPARIELSFPEFLRLMERPASEKVREMRRSAERLIAQITSDETRKKAEEVLAGTKDLAGMQRVLGRIHQRIAEQDEVAELRGDDEEPAAPPRDEPTTETAGVAAPSGSPAAGGLAPVANKPPAPDPSLEGAQAGGAAPTAPPAEEDDSGVDFPAHPWTPWGERMPREVLARLGAGQGAHAQNVARAFQEHEKAVAEGKPTEKVACSAAVFNLLAYHHTAPLVATWWAQVGVEVTFVGSKPPAAPLLDADQLGRVLLIAPVVSPEVLAAGAAS